VNEPGKGQAVWRGATKRCARCGERKLFKWWASMVERCPRCGHKFERADGFWLGSIMMNMTFTFLLFLVVFFGGLRLGEKMLLTESCIIIFSLKKGVGRLNI